jgi:hypothetical protein
LTKLKINTVVLLCFATAAGVGTAVPQSGTGLSQPLPVDPGVTIGKLNNGLRYYVRTNNRRENRAELQLVLNLGSVLEDED